MEYDGFDKLLHFLSCGFISSMMYGFFRANRLDKTASFVMAVSLTMAVGLGKELLDDYIDMVDLICDMLGAILIIIAL